MPAELRTPIEIAGVRIDPVTVDEARARARAALRQPGMFQIATVNVDFLARAQSTPELMTAFQRSALNVADGVPVLWLSRILGRRLPERVAGADLVPLLVRDAGESGAGVFLLGGEGGAAAAAAAKWGQLFPEAKISGWYEPPHAPIAEMDSDDIIERIRRSGARLLLVAFGHPKQDLWIHRHRDRLPVAVAAGVGMVFDLAAGRVRRAPRWMQRSGLEWLYRMVHEPGRLVGRYANDARWMVTIAATAGLRRMARGLSARRHRPAI